MVRRSQIFDDHLPYLQASLMNLHRAVLSKWHASQIDSDSSHMFEGLSDQISNTWTQYSKWFDEIVMYIMNEEVLNFSTACKHIARLTKLDSRLSICVESTVAWGRRHLSCAMIKDASNHGKLHSRRQSKQDRSEKRKHQTKIEV